MKKKIINNTIAIIPARSGSKRIKNKNIKQFFGKPFIYYAINAAKKSQIFNDIVVSTDSNKIRKIANKFGAETPFLRSKKLSNDKADTISVIKDCILNLEKKGRFYKYVCCIYPANPFLKTKNLIKAFKILKSNRQLDYVMTAIKFNHPIERSFKIENSKILVKGKNKFYKKMTQDIENSYHDGAQFYLSKSKNWKMKKNIFSKKTYVIELSEIESHDIDNPIDIEIAKLKFKLKK